jgi:flagellar biosynthesis/type III secretory pathway chaperone
MVSLESELGRLSQLMEQEIAVYRQLVEATATESECLKKGANDSLVEVIRTIEHHTAKLRQLDERIQSSMGVLFETLGENGKEKTLSRLLTLLPPVRREKLKPYQKTLVFLQQRVRKTNEKNKTFIQENLKFLQHLISFLIHPVQDSSCYPGAGRSSLSVPSYALNREV